MQALSLSSLRRLKKDLDVFRGARPVGADLLRAGLHPPLPRCGDTLIWGFHILREAGSLGLPRLPCTSLPAAGFLPMMGLALRLENRTGRYSWVEKSRILEAARRFSAREEPAFDVAEAMAALSPQIEGREDARLFHRIELYAGLDPDLRKLVDWGNLDLKTALRTQSLPASALSPVLGSRLSFSRRRQFLHLLCEISRRDRLSARKAAELARRAGQAPDPVAELWKLRFPTLSCLQERFRRWHEELLRGTGVRVSPPPFFEGEAFRVEFSFSDRQTLGRRLRALRVIEERCDELLALLG